MISFTAAEWIYLAALLEVKALVGIPDLFEGQPSREVEVALFRARLALSERGGIDVAPDGRVRVAPWVAELVRLCAGPETTLVLPGGGGARYYHLSAGRAVEQRVDRERGQIDLVELRGGAEPVMEQVAAGLLDGDQPVRFYLPSVPDWLFLMPPGAGEPVLVDLITSVGGLAQRYSYFFQR